MPASGDDIDDELWELLTCHRDDPCLHLALHKPRKAKTLNAASLLN